MADDDRWEAVFAAEHARLWRSLLAHTRDPELASDAVAEAFAQAVRRGVEVRDPAAWVWRSAFRIAGGLLHERGRSPVEGVGDDHVATDALPDDVVALLDALDQLSDLDRRVVVLSLVGGLSATEVGSVVGASSGAVRVRLHRARGRLRDGLRDPIGGRTPPPRPGADVARRATSPSQPDRRQPQRTGGSPAIPPRRREP